MHRNPDCSEDAWIPDFSWQCSRGGCLCKGACEPRVLPPSLGFLELIYFLRCLTPRFSTEIAAVAEDDTDTPRICNYLCTR